MTYRYVSPKLFRLGQLALLVEALIRGLNYVIVGHPMTQTVVIASLSAPTVAWGAAFTLLGATGLVGEWLMEKGESEHRYWPSWVAHTGLMCLYGALAVSALVALPAGASSSFGAYFTSVADFSVMALWHWIFARRRKNV